MTTTVHDTVRWKFKLTDLLTLIVMEKSYIIVNIQTNVMQ